MTLSGKDIILLDWYSEVMPSGAFTDPKVIEGRPILFPLAAKEPILQRDLGVEGSGVGLAGKIPEGMRGVAVRSNEIVGVAGFLYPGSRVDLLMTFTPPGGNMPITDTVLQNVEVLTAGQTIEPDPQGKPQQVSVITLLLSPENSQKLQLASGQGNIQFVLRNGMDVKNVDIHPTRLDELVASAKPPAPPTTKKTSRPSQRSHQSVYDLDVIEEAKRTVHKFESKESEI